MVVILVIRVVIVVLFKPLRQQGSILVIRRIECSHWVMIPTFSHQFGMRIVQVCNDLARDILCPTLGLVDVHQMNCHTTYRMIVIIRRKMHMLFNVVPVNLIQYHMVGVDLEIHDYVPVLKASNRLEGEGLAFHLLDSIRQPFATNTFLYGHHPDSVHCLSSELQ